MSFPPRMPLPVRALNAAGGALRTLGVPLVRLDEQSLLREASRRTGLEDFGDARFRKPLGLLLASLEGEARLTILGRTIARNDLLRLLENRLRLHRVLRQHPEIEDRPVRAPLFVLGQPRTGTTILHELLALDPENRVPMTWECNRIWPPPERASYETDPRIAESNAQLAGVDRILPEFKNMHRMGAQLPQECVTLMAHDFVSMIHHTTYDVTRYEDWIEKSDHRWVYASHRRQLQYLQWRCPAERWVLKSPAHLWQLEALLAVYPDARFVQCHRDPLKVVASITSLVAMLRCMGSDHVVPEEIARDWSRRISEGLDRTMAVRESGRIPDERFFDMHFRDFIRDEVAMVRRLYDHFGLRVSPLFEERLRRYLADNARDKHGGHRYDFADSGLDEAEERARYARYVERHDIVLEELSQGGRL